ncbi:MAG: triosephosphate isomerase (TIM) [Candidatus Peregrinibacteria bacterium Gr01-1014_25]|nr:MAG: triosephosphate isomerase (TIM) [Candidatus Peregrinibacteria bacterium Gr01-1014_25]
MKKPLVAANWKMNPPPAGWDAADSPYRPHAAIEVVVFPSPVDIPACVRAKMVTGGQYGHPQPHGAHTGDVSMAMLKEAGCSFVLCGHSERRRDHGESDAFVAEQVVAALEAGLTPVLCVGETAEQREAGKEKDVLKKQLRAIPEGLFSSLTADRCPPILAYEPVWAIGTGKTATPRQAQEMHAYIRSLLPTDARGAVRILYGGSTNAMNARALLAEPDIDGFLVGGTSLKPAEFADMVRIADARNA